MPTTATKTDPALWERAKEEAKSRMGGKHSARAMQLATQIYKKKGGGYSGPKPTASSNSLKKWTKQKWQWTGKDKPGPGGTGVYLPKAKAERLKSTEEGRKKLQAASAKKREATRRGEQYSSHGLAAGTSLKKEAAIAGSGTASGNTTSHLQFSVDRGWRVTLPSGPHVLVKSVPGEESASGFTSYSLHAPAKEGGPLSVRSSPSLGHIILKDVGRGVSEISGLSVDPQHRGKGYAHALIQLARHLPGGSHTLVVKPDPFKDRAVSRDALEKMYRAHGFTEIPGAESRPHLRDYLFLHTPDAEANSSLKKEATVPGPKKMYRRALEALHTESHNFHATRGEKLKQILSSGKVIPGTTNYQSYPGIPESYWGRGRPAEPWFSSHAIGVPHENMRAQVFPPHPAVSHSPGLTSLFSSPRVTDANPSALVGYAEFRPYHWVQSPGNIPITPKSYAVAP